MAATSPVPDGGAWYVSEVLDALAPMGGYTLDSPDGGEVHVCGELNAPPSVARTRTALREASAAGFDAEAVYRRAVVMFRALNGRRRETHPRWDWPEPPYDDVRPGGSPSAGCEHRRTRSTMTARLARFFHRTTAARARAILRGGFKDSVGQFLADTEHAGVWLSDRPLDENEGARGDALLVVEIAADLVERYEWIEHGKPYREFLVPAAMLNEHGTVAPADDEASGPIA